MQDEDLNELANLVSHLYYPKDEQNSDFRLTGIINLCFKLSTDASTDRFNHLRGYDPYYDWLLDMENFNYATFNPRWVSEFATVYFLNRMKKVSLIKDKVRQYLKENFDPFLSGHYLTLTS